MAATWEYDENNNMDGARVLLQRGLRVNKLSTRLRLEWCRMELRYRDKVQTRLQLAGLSLIPVVVRQAYPTRFDGMIASRDNGRAW